VSKLDSENENATADAGNDSPAVNREIKDGVFKLLFETPENAAELYSALKGVPCSPDEIQIITITTIISGQLKNDLAFVVKGRVMVLGEHMSSPYANMPVRFIMYLGQLYEKWIKMKGEEKYLYGSKLYKIPTPEFVVFYNGTTTRPEKETLKLSDAFESEGDNDLGFLELEVPVYNINVGMNGELFRNSSKLRQYSEFIAKVRELNKLYEDYTQAVKEAVNHCIANDILAEFLREQGGKIVSILSTEYDVEIAKRVYGDERAEDERIKFAKNLLRRNRPIEEIMEDVGLSRKEIESLSFSG
jgi:hypothetical protein